MAPDPVLVAMFEVIGTEVLVSRAPAEHVPDRYEQGVLNGDNGLLGPLPGADAVIECAVVAALGARGGPGDLLQDLAQPSVAVPGTDGLAFAGAFVITRAEPRPRCQLCRAGKAAHIDTDFRQDDLCGPLGHPRNRLQQAVGLSEREHVVLDLGIQFGDLSIQSVDELELLTQYKTIVFSHTPRDRLA